MKTTPSSPNKNKNKNQNKNQNKNKTNTSKRANTPRSASRKNSPAKGLNSTTGMNTGTSSRASCPRHSTQFVRHATKSASEKHSGIMRTILAAVVSALILFSSMKITAYYPPGGVSKECTIPTLGWFTKSRTTTLHGISNRHVGRECLKLQQKAQNRIESLRDWNLEQSIQTSMALKKSRTAIMESPLKVAENVFVSVKDASELLTKASRSVNNVGAFVENITGYLSMYTGTIVGLSLATMFLILMAVQQQVLLPWTAFKKLIGCMVSMVSKIPVTKIYKGLSYGVSEISTLVVRLIYEGQKMRNASKSPNTSPLRRNTVRATRKIRRTVA